MFRKDSITRQDEPTDKENFSKHDSAMCLIKVSMSASVENSPYEKGIDNKNKIH